MRRLPGVGGRQGLLSQLAKVAGNASKAGRSFTPAIVAARAVDGALEVIPVDGECPQRAEGQEGIGDPLALSSEPRRVGSGGLTALRRGLDGRTLWLERQIPPDVPRGRQSEVIVLGQGLRSNMQLDYMLEGKQLHPGITVAAIDPIESPVAGFDAVKVTVVVTTTAPLDNVAQPVGYERSSVSPLDGVSLTSKTKPAFYRIVPNFGEVRYLAYFVDGNQLVCWSVTESGAYAEEIGRASASGFRWDRAARVHSDSSGTLGADSIVWTTGNRTRDDPEASGLHVADVRNAVAYHRSSTVGVPMIAALIAGEVHYLTWEAQSEGSTTPVRHYKCKADLSDVETDPLLHTVFAPSGYAARWWEYFGAGFTVSSAVCYLTGEDLSGVALDRHAQVYIPFSFGSPSSEGVGGQETPHSGAPWGSQSVAGRWLWDGQPFGEGGGAGWVEVMPESWLDGLELDVDQRERIFTAGDAGGTIATSWVYHAARLFEYRPLSDTGPDRIVDLPDHPLLGRAELIVPL